MTTHTLKIPLHAIQSEHTRKKIFAWILSIGIASAIVYSYFVGSIVFHIIARKNIEAENRVLSSHIAENQFTYLSTIGTIDKSYAEREGYEVPAHPVYISKKPVAANIGIHGNEL